MTIFPHLAYNWVILFLKLNLWGDISFFKFGKNSPNKNEVRAHMAGGRDKVRPQAGRTCEQSMLSSYPASIVCLRAKHACRPKYAFGERIHAGTTCLHSCARRAGVGWGLNRKLELRPKRHELIFGGIPSSLVIHPKRKPFSHAFGFGFGKTVVSASELCSVVLIN